MKNSLARLSVLAACAAVLFGKGSACAQSAGESGSLSPVRGLLSRFERLLQSRCLTPETGATLQNLVASGALQPVLSDQFTLVGGNVHPQHIELQVEDQAHRSYTLTLALPGSASGTPDGQGRRFLYFLALPPGPAHPRAAGVLLGIAALVDGAVPESALGPCSGGEQVHGDRRYPRAFALGAALSMVAIVLAAVGFGLGAVRSRR